MKFLVYALSFVFLLFTVRLTNAQTPENQETLYLADSLFVQKQYEEASNIYRKLLAQASPPEQQIRLLLRTGHCYYEPGDYRKARPLYQQAWELSSNIEDKKLIAECHYTYAKVLGRMSEYQLALELFEKARSLWATFSDSASQEQVSDCLRALAITHFSIDQLTEAEDEALQSLELTQELFGPDHLEAAVIYDLLGSIYRKMDDYPKSLANYTNCLRIRQDQLPDTHILFGAIYHNLAVLYKTMGESEDALDYDLKALAIFEKLSPEHPRTGDSYLSLGQSYLDAGDYRSAKDYYLQALSIYRNTFGENNERVGTIYNVLANVYRLQGDFVQARSYAERGLDVTRAVLGPHHDRVASGLTKIGDLEADIGNYQASIEAYSKALKIRKQVLGEDATRTAFLYFMLGQVYQEAGMPSKSIPLLKRAVTIYRNHGREGTEDISNVYHSLGLAYLDLEEYDASREYLLLDTEILSQTYSDNHPYLASNYHSRALWFERQDQLDSALVYLHRALAALSPDFEAPEILPPLSSISSTYEYLEFLRRTADVLMKRNERDQDLITALDYYRVGAELTDRLRSQYRSNNAKLFFQNNANPINTAGFRVAYQLYQKYQDSEYLNTAFWFAERSKAGLLTAALQGLDEQSFSDVPDSVRNQAESLRTRIDRTEQLMMDERLSSEDSSSENLRQLRKEQIFLQSSYDSLMVILEKKYPRFFQMNYGTKVVTLKEVQQSIPDSRTAFLEYFVADTTLFTFIITPDSVKLSSVPWTPQQQEAIQALREPPDILAWSAQGTTLMQSYLSRSYRLYQTVVGDLINPDEYQRLVIVPHGSLFYLPYESLVMSPAENFKQAKFLGLNYAIHYANSATLWSPSGEYRTSGERKFLGVAPAYGSVLVDALPVREINFRGPLGSLRYNTTEIAQAATFFPGRQLTGTLATEEAFKQQAPQSDILHLAMHALVSDSLPMQSRLLFTPQSDTTEDGLLHAYELYNIQLPVELVVLSACNTGFGQLQAGEGVISLGHAFQYAGCRSLMMSLWPAEDQGSAQITSYFYHHLSDGIAKDEALRLARIDYLKQADPLRAHPYYWSHLVMVGDMTPLSDEFTFQWWMAVLGVIVLGGSLVWYQRRKLRDNHLVNN